jgi:archaellin
MSFVAADTLEIEFVTSSGSKKVDLLDTDIAWTTDKQYKFRNPPGYSTDRMGGL